MTLYQIQRSVRDLIRDDENIREAGIGVTHTDAGDIATEIDNALAEVGLHVNVRPIEWSPDTSAGHVSVGFAVVTIAIGEIVPTNRAHDGYITAQNLAEYLMSKLNGVKSEGMHGPLNLSDGPKLVIGDKVDMNVVTISFRFQHLISPDSVKEVFT